MTDDRLERALSDAITDLAGTSNPAYLNDILERTARTRQRPWWTFPGRYFSMSSTLKFATAASLAFVLGIGLAPLILPAENSGPAAPGAAATPSADAVEPSPAELFEGRWEALNQLPSETAVRFDTYPTEQHNRLWAFRTIAMSDARLDGKIVTSNNLHTYGDVGVEVYRAMFRIDNDHGSWVEDPGLVMRFPGDDPTARTTVFLGEGDYSGLKAIVELDWLSSESGLIDVRGIVIDGDIPPTPPDAPAPEA